MESRHPPGGYHASLDDQLAFLALTHTIDQWNSQYPLLASQLLNDTDQQLLSECYVAHLMPAADSFWWNGDNASIAMTHLLKQKYPQVKVAVWKRNRLKASDLLKTWRKDAALLYTQVIKNGRDDYDVTGEEADEYVGEETEDGLYASQSSAAEDGEGESSKGTTDAMVVAHSRYTKRRVEASERIESPKKARKRFVYDSEGSEDEVFGLCRSKAKLAASTPKRAAAAMLTSPQSGQSSPVALVDSNTEDEGPLEARGYYGRRRGRRHRLVEPESPPVDAAMANPVPLSLTRIRTMASIEPTKTPTHEHKCLAALQEAVDSVAKSRVAFSAQERREASRQLNKLKNKLEKLGSAVKRLNDAIQP
ncbi:hypothetical protein CSUB01_02222 [Colletotrichum sublineola]|uniref:Uncharacterized protein n=1 Tax=Colletotrichum sublineola TaxID=1173701 RepID=A0A066WYR1_COLSU|nr:hypothetical protein CSUB01_02222 [Colletotrichum sublineola]